LPLAQRLRLRCCQTEKLLNPTITSNAS